MAGQLELNQQTLDFEASSQLPRRSRKIRSRPY